MNKRRLNYANLLDPYKFSEYFKNISIKLFALLNLWLIESVCVMVRDELNN